MQQGMIKPKRGRPQCYGIAQSKRGGGHDPYKHSALPTDSMTGKLFLTVVSNSLAKTISEIVTAFAFSDSENGMASLLMQLFFLCLL